MLGLSGFVPTGFVSQMVVESFAPVLVDVVPTTTTTTTSSSISAALFSCTLCPQVFGFGVYKTGQFDTV